MATLAVAVDVKERPILFSGPMVRAILDGRKTQTRRVIKEAKADWELGTKEEWVRPTDTHPQLGGAPKGRALFKYERSDDTTGMCAIKPAFEIGHRLWVRESLVRPDGDSWLYAADNQPVMVDKADLTAMLTWAHHKEQDYCPSIHAPRWASRITLEVTDVRVQRLSELSEEDAKAEGIEIGQRATLPGDHPRQQPCTRCGEHYKRHIGVAMGCPGTSSVFDPSTYRGGFAFLWNQINSKRDGGVYAWDKEPWVWAVSFRRIS